LSTLFTISSSWYESTWLFEQLGFASDGDSILLLQDAVLALQSPITLGSFLAKCKARDIHVFALIEDVLLRGVKNQYAEIDLIAHAGFVDLVCTNDKQVAW